MTEIEITQLLNSAKLAPLQAQTVLQDGQIKLLLQDGEVVLLKKINRAEAIALEHVQNQTLNPAVFANKTHMLFLESEIAEINSENFSRMGTALGEMQASLKNQTAPSLNLRDAHWFMQQTPNVLALLAEHSEQNELLSFAELAQLEEVGAMISELSEPLTGLRSSLLHGNCSIKNWVQEKTKNIVLTNWQNTCFGLPWLDAAKLSEDAERAGSEALVSFLRSYAKAANYEVGVLADLLPFVRALHCVLKIDVALDAEFKDAELLKAKLLKAEAKALLQILTP